jgi:hypothetical protein
MSWRNPSYLSMGRKSGRPEISSWGFVCPFVLAGLGLGDGERQCEYACLATQVGLGSG